ncbi:MAG: hypothetical protein EAZ69_30020 [Oscillatoriales cyanobacterium]|nr:MAG: hypothetical protein EAZ69_30020 [Oscillatoriales cyanobacterium]
MRRFWICDRADGLRLPETGFLPNLWAATKYFRKKPGFSPLIRLAETGFSQKPGFCRICGLQLSIFVKTQFQNPHG